LTDEPRDPRHGSRSKDGERRGFFRDALAGLVGSPSGLRETLSELVGDLDREAAPTFVPPQHQPAKRKFGPDKHVRRPPGALAERWFLEACTRCGACVAACPEGTLIAVDGDAPRARVETHPCTMCVDVPCAAACETGALVVGPVADIVAFGTARVLTRLCLNHGRSADPEGESQRVDQATFSESKTNQLGWSRAGRARPSQSEDEPCEQCTDWCPVPDTLKLGPDAIPRVNAATCTGCGLCAAHCAAYPRAIGVDFGER